MTAYALFTLSWKSIGAFMVVAALYFIAFSKDISLLNRHEKEHLTGLKQQTGGKISGHLLNTLIGIGFVIVSIILYFVFYN